MATTDNSPTMTAVTVPRYGGPNVLDVTRVPRPVAGEGEILVRVEASSVNAADYRIMQADPWMIRLMYGLQRPKITALGIDVFGTVETVGAGVTEFTAGERVIGEVSGAGCGAYAEFVAAPAKLFARAPSRLNPSQSAALPGGGLAALQGLRDHGELAPGQHVLIVGASGSVGMIAVQIAVAMGAEVTGVCRTEKVDLVRSLGAGQVVDYTAEDVTAREERFDLVLDAGAYRSIFDYQRVLTEHGVYVHVGGSMRRLFQTMVWGSVRSKRGGRRWRTFIAEPNSPDLAHLSKLADEGKITPVIDRCYPLDMAPEALGYVLSGKAVGKVILQTTGCADMD